MSCLELQINILCCMDLRVWIGSAAISCANFYRFATVISPESARALSHDCSWVSTLWYVHEILFGTMVSKHNDVEFFEHHVLWRIHVTRVCCLKSAWNVHHSGFRERGNGWISKKQGLSYLWSCVSSRCWYWSLCCCCCCCCWWWWWCVSWFCSWYCSWCCYCSCYVSWSLPLLFLSFAVVFLFLWGLCVLFLGLFFVLLWLLYGSWSHLWYGVSLCVCVCVCVFVLVAGFVRIIAMVVGLLIGVVVCLVLARVLVFSLRMVLKCGVVVGVVLIVRVSMLFLLLIVFLVLQCLTLTVSSSLHCPNMTLL